MKLMYWDFAPNVGDQLNPWLWPKLLPGLLDDDESEILFGIGTILHLPRPAATRRVAVFGSGVGYHSVPETDASWRFYCVRGPATAKALGLPDTAVVTDPGSLVREFFPAPSGTKKHRFSFIPHWTTARAAPVAWQKLCADIGVAYIDPLWPVEKVLTAIGETETLLAEAMHGAIMADALRVPWVAVATAPDILEFKWRDWCASLDIELDFHRALPLELRLRPSSNMAMYDEWRLRGPLSAARLALASSSLARQLSAIAKNARPQLSASSTLDNRIEELLKRRDQLQRDILSGSNSR